MSKFANWTLEQKLQALESGARHATWEYSLAHMMGGMLKALFGEIPDVDLDGETVKEMVSKVRHLMKMKKDEMGDKQEAVEGIITSVLEMYGEEPSLRDMERKIEVALRAKENIPKGTWFWLLDIFPNYVIYRRDNDDTSYLRTYKFAEDGKVEFGDSKKVQQIWVPVEEADSISNQHLGIAPKPVQESTSAQVDLTETFRALEADFDEENMSAVVTIIKPGLSLNKRMYKETALSSGFALFEGAKMYIDHPTKAQAGQPRSLSSLVSKLENVHVSEEDGRMRGTARFFRREFFEFAKAAKNDIGVSINALCTGTPGVMLEGERVDIIEGFEKVHSVDWVAEPAAGGRVEAIEAIIPTMEEQMTILAQVTLDQLKTDRPDLVSALVAEVQNQLNSAQTNLESVTKERDDLQEKLKVSEAKQAEVETLEAVRVLVAQEQALPDAAKERVINSFKGKIIAQEQRETEVKTAIDSEKDYLGKLGTTTTAINGNGPSNPAENQQKVSATESLDRMMGVAAATSSDE